MPRSWSFCRKTAELTAAEIADRIGLSKAPCWRRIQKLQEEGVIRRTVAILDARALNVGTTVFVTLKTGNHSEAWFQKFVRAVRDIPEVTEIHRMSGDVDYLIRIVVPDIDAYDVVYKRLISAVEFQDVSASFTLETIKHTTALPLCYLKLAVSVRIHGAEAAALSQRVVANDLGDPGADLGAVDVVGTGREHRLARAPSARAG